jgi:PAS domain S-box-containing protein
MELAEHSSQQSGTFEAQLEGFFDHISDPILLLNSNWEIQKCNSAFLHIFGYEERELIGQNPGVFCAEAEKFVELPGQDDWAHETISLQTKRGATVTKEVVFKRFDNKDEHNSKIIAIYRDIFSEFPEESKRQSDRLKTIGSLVGGIAHDFNNILTPIYGYANLALDDVSKVDRNYERLIRIAKGANLAKRLVRQILDFGQGTDDEKSNVQLAKLLAENVTLLRNSVPKDFEIIADISPLCSPIFASQIQINQLLEKLFDESILRNQLLGGSIHISLEEVAFAEDDDLIPTPKNSIGNEIIPGSYARLTVRDNGDFPLIEPLQDLFDPISKNESPDERNGFGTKLGMATIYDIVVGHKGTLEIKADDGFTVLVFIPISKALDIIDTKMSLSKAADTQRIMIVDDSEENVEVTTESLESLGYSVEAFTDAKEALEFAKKSIDFFDLVITDQAMPNMTGDVFAGEIKKLRPQMPIILVTGFSTRVDANNFKEKGFFDIVMKPWSMAELNDVIQRALVDESR